MSTTLAGLAESVPAERPAASSPVASDVIDRGAFAALEPEWNALVEATDPQPFYRHEYIKSYLDNFAPQAPLSVVTLRSANGRLKAALPLIQTRGSVCGFPVRQLESPTNVHSLRFDLVTDVRGPHDDDEECGRAIFDHLSKDKSWDVIRIADVPDGGQAWQILRAAEQAGHPTGVWEAQRSPYIALPGSYEELAAGLTTKFKGNLRRRRNRLAFQGRIVVEGFPAGEIRETLFEECLAIERKSWKGRNGSAVTQSKAAHGFHLELLKTPEYRKFLSLHVLRVAGIPIAFHYGVTTAGVYSLVMTSFVEAYREFAPGHLLTEDVLKDCIARGIKEWDFLGCDLPWKLDWTDTVRPHHWLYIFRNSLKGRALRRLKFEWAKTARMLLTRREA